MTAIVSEIWRQQLSPVGRINGFPPPLPNQDEQLLGSEEEVDGQNQLLLQQHHENKNVDDKEISIVFDPRDEFTSDAWIRRNPSLIRLTGKHPFNCEPPLKTLMTYGFITPSHLHYVRNHGSVPKAVWDAWSVEVGDEDGALLRRPSCFTMDQLINTFRSHEFPVTLVCAGNRRKEQNMVKQTVGFNWGAAGVSTAVWRGVLLRDVLKKCGVVDREGLHVWFEGEEDLPGGNGSKYGTSVALEVAMDPSRDIILAYMMNGDILPPDHGFPVRMIIPGFIGGRMVKWLRRIKVVDKESQNYYHFHDNRVLPSLVDSADMAKDQGWWHKPEYIINDLSVNSVITTPGHDEILPINTPHASTDYIVKGYAYSGRGNKVTRVEVTLDGGETWMLCQLDHSEKPNRYGKYWCWCFWSLQIDLLHLFGAKEIAVRAWDQSQNTQPERLNWNLMGMMNNCWFRVKINSSRPKGGEMIGFVFEHPTQPANDNGGWMVDRNLKIIKNKTLSGSTAADDRRHYSISEVGTHNSLNSAWIVVHGNVYDCTDFVRDHPGGVDSILINAGTDCTEEFDAIHSEKAKAMLDTYLIGRITTNTETVESLNGLSIVSSLKPPPPLSHVALVGREKVQCKLISKISISHDVRKFRFALPSNGQTLGLPVGKHISVCAEIAGKMCIRAYTPTSKVDKVGHFDLVVKIYHKGVDEKFPDGGLMSQHLDSLDIGKTIDVKGPLGHIEYTGCGNFSVHGKPRRRAKRLVMIAGGTGITPMYQLMQAILADPQDDTEMWLVYANKTEDDVLLMEELDQWARENEHRLKVWYVINKAKREGWAYTVGFVSEDVLRDHIPAWSGDIETLVVACGPPPMIKFAVRPNMDKLGYEHSFLIL